MIDIDIVVKDGVVKMSLDKVMMIPEFREQVLSAERREIILSKLTECTESERKSIISWLRIH